MILLLDTATPLCHLSLIETGNRYDISWEANRELAKGLLGFIEREVVGQGKAVAELTGVAVFKGPGSFTGLRIGLSVLNTLADALSIPIVGETGDDWQEKAIIRLQNGENEQIVLPFYGSEAHITLPRK